MRINSASTNFFTNRLVVGSGIPIAIGIVMLVIFLITSSFTELSDSDLRAKQVNLIIRQIGHRLLLQAGDSTSRVLPVTKINDGTFLLTFENEFVFNHDSLMVLSRGLLPKAQFPSGYTVTVHECKKAGIVYGFQVNNTSPDILACNGRSQPSGCYSIEFAFPDFFENVAQEKSDIDQRTESVKVDPQEANSIPPMAIGAIGTEEFKAKAYDNDIERTEELKSVNVDSQEANPIPPMAIGAIGTEEFKATIFDYPLINLVNSGMLVLLGVGVTLLIGRFGKGLVPVPVQNQNHAIITESVPELAALGKFLFDVKGQRLLLESEVISLTDKECKILELLNKSFGELIPRETLMQKIWLNEGVITGRSLDMFVSKLRKKLSRDPELRIANVHGKGYKLEIPGIETL